MATTYTPFGALATITDGCTPAGSCTSAVETYSYNNRLQPVMIQLSSPGVTNCLVYNYYTVASNPTTCAVPSYPPPSGAQNNGNMMGYYYSDPQLGHSATFGYDTLNRLTRAVATASGGNSASYNWTYNYDPFGNMQCSGSTGGVDTCAAMTYNTSTNRLTAIGSQTPVYDAAGNLLSDGTGTGSQSYTWDAEGHMTSVSSPSGGSAIATYNYNALGQRVQATGSGVGTYPHFQYYDAFGNLALWGDNTLWNEDPLPRVGGRLYGEYSYYTTFLHTNPLGSTGTTTAADGTFVSDEIYDPWGQRWGTWNFQWWAERFAGMQRRDQESGLDHTDFRMFASSYGRWLSPDPLAGDVSNPQSLNRYAYVLNNPTNFVDPSGLGPCDSSNPPPFCSRAEAHVNDAISRLEGFADWEAMMMCFAEGSAVCDNPESSFSASISLGGISGGSSGPLSGDFGAGLGPPPTASSGLPCDFGACGGAGAPGGNGFAQAAAIPACVILEPCGAAVLTGLAVVGTFLAAEEAGTWLSQYLHGVQPWSGKFPGWDPAKAPDEGWVWKGNGPAGSPEGNWWNPGTGESLHPDLNHPGPIGPHWDWKDPNGEWWRVFPDDTAVPKH